MDQKSDKDQLELSFDSQDPRDGVEAWRRERARAKASLARSLGLPLDHPVEVWLAGGIRLRGVLRLHQEELFGPAEKRAKVRLQVDGVVFEQAEIESCVRVD